VSMARSSLVMLDEHQNIKEERDLFFLLSE